MTDSGGAFQPDTEEIELPFRPRSVYVGHKAFGSGDGAVLVDTGLAHKLRTAAEWATQEGRVTGGLLYGRGLTDDQGTYLVVDGFIEGGPGENSGDRLPADGTDDFTLSEGDLRLLREDAARMYSASFEVGWWRTLPALGDFTPGDFVTQAELVGPGGVGLLVYGSGIHWGTAYLGPEGLAPDSAGTLVASGHAPEPPPAADLQVAYELTPDEPEVVDIAHGGSLLEEEPDPVLPAEALVPPPAAVVAPDGTAGTLAPARRRRAPGAARVTSRVRVPPRARAWASGRPASPGPKPEEMPGDVQFVVVLLAIVVVVAAIIVGFLVHSAIVALIVAVLGLLALSSTVWMSHR